jgi:mRNA interferase MazF
MSKIYVPSRNDICWLDYEPTKDKEIGKYRPTLVLSSQEYNQKTGLLIGCPISTSIRGGATEVLVNYLDNPSVIVSHLIHTLDWKQRQARFIRQAEQTVVDEVLLRLISLIGADEVIEKVLNK